MSVNPFSLKRPCRACPFLREGGVKFLGQSYARMIAESVISSDGRGFFCHGTPACEEDGDFAIGGQGAQYCAGSLLFMEAVNEGKPSDIRIAERLGFYDRNAYAGSSPVFDSIEGFLGAQSDER